MRLKISIIIPAYNAADTIEECINSIESQDYDNLEIIIVNDGSKDDTKIICEKLKLKYKNIVLISKENGGVSSARNIGISVATGDYIIFVDADDEISQNFISNGVLHLMDANNDELIGCSYYSVSKNNKKCKIRDFTIDKESFLEDLVTAKISGYSWGYFFNKNKLNDILFNEKIGFMEDTLFLINYCQKVHNIKYFKDLIYIYNNFSESITRRKKINIKNILSIDYVIDYLDKFSNEVHHNALILRKCKLIESEIGKASENNVLEILNSNDEIIKIFKDIIADAATSNVYKKYFKMIIGSKKFSFRTYKFLRNGFKKIRR